MNKPHTYPSKIMLVGEYGVVVGGDALTIPFTQFNARGSRDGTALHFLHSGEIRPVEFDPSSIPGGYRFFLLDSGEQFETGPLEEHFLQQMNEPGFASSIRNEYLVLNQKLIEVLLGIREADPGLLVRAISDYQFTHFHKMIPDTVLDFWIDGQVSNEYYLKLNGSDGRYMLGITHETSIGNLEEQWKEKVIWIE